MIDTHTHLYLTEFDVDNVDVCTDAVSRAVAADVEHMIFPNVDLSTIEPMTLLAARHPGRVSKAMGLHPTEVCDDYRDVLDKIIDRLGDGNDYVAVGEVGIDLYWDKTYEDEQMQVLEMQAQHAAELHLPLIIHCRDGLAQTLEVLQGINNVSGVFHCFAGESRDIDAIRKVGDFYFGIGGVVTFKNSTLRNHLEEIGLERILLETDSPYLAPVPNRGKRNESAFMPFIAEHIAQNMSLTIDDVDTATTTNAKRLFGI